MDRSLLKIAPLKEKPAKVKAAAKPKDQKTVKSVKPPAKTATVDQENMKVVAPVNTKTLDLSAITTLLKSNQKTLASLQKSTKTLSTSPLEEYKATVDPIIQQLQDQLKALHLENTQLHDSLQKSAAHLDFFASLTSLDVLSSETTSNGTLFRCKQTGAQGAIEYTLEKGEEWAYDPVEMHGDNDIDYLGDGLEFERGMESKLYGRIREFCG